MYVDLFAAALFLLVSAFVAMVVVALALETYDAIDSYIVVGRREVSVRDVTPSREAPRGGIVDVEV